LLPVKEDVSPLIPTVPPHVLDLTSKAPAPKLDPDTIPIDACSALPPSMEQHNALGAEWGRLPTLYLAEGFWKALQNTSLTSRYPLLVHNITHGSLIGAPAPLTHTTIMPNLCSALLQPGLVATYILDEVLLGCMSGPFTLEETH